MASRARRRSESRFRSRNRVATATARSTSSGAISVAPSSTAFSTRRAKRSRSPAPTARVRGTGLIHPGHRRDDGLNSRRAHLQQRLTDSSRTINQSHPLSRLASPHLQMVRLRIVQLDGGAGLQASRRREQGNHGRRAATAHQVSSTTSSTTSKPASTRGARNSSASAQLHTGEDRDATGSDRIMDLGQQRRALMSRRIFETMTSAGASSGVICAASPWRKVTCPARPLRPALAAATSRESSSTSTPTAQPAPIFLAAMVRFRFPSRDRARCRRDARNARAAAGAARVEPCSPLAERHLRIDDDYHLAGCGVGPQPGRNEVEPADPSRGEAAAPGGSPVHLRLLAVGHGDVEPCAAARSRSSASAAARSSAKETRVPSARSSTACPVRPTSQAATASRRSGVACTSIEYQVTRPALP